MAAKKKVTSPELKVAAGPADQPPKARRPVNAMAVVLGNLMGAAVAGVLSVWFPVIALGLATLWSLFVIIAADGTAAKAAAFGLMVLVVLGFGARLVISNDQAAEARAAQRAHSRDAGAR